MANNLSILIPAAGQGKRMKSFGPKALIKVANGETVIARQLRLLKAAFPRSPVVVVAGFEAEKLSRHLLPQVKVVNNTEFADTNVAHSLALGLKVIPPTHSVLVVYGDLVFSRDMLDIQLGHSSLLVTDQLRPEEVGVTVVGEQVSRLAFGLPLKWAQVALLLPLERQLFLAVANDPWNSRHYGAEVLNEVLEAGGAFHALKTGGSLVEIDSSKDIEKAAQIP